jgi:altronate hydrolase
MDFNAGTVLSGEQTLDEAALDLMQMVGEIAGGKASKPEALGHREYFVMYKHQDTPELAAGCRA